VKQFSTKFRIEVKVRCQ